MVEANAHTDPYQRRFSLSFPHGRGKLFKKGGGFW